MKRYKLNKRKFARFIIVVLAVGVITGVAVDAILYPECYSTSWRYQLQNDIERGKKEIVEYYNRRYIANGRELFKKG